MNKNNAGRPTKMTNEVVQKLEDAFLLGCTDAEACCHAGISRSTLYAYCNVSAVFSERKEALKHHPTLKAKRIISQALDNGDLVTANKVIDRKNRSKTKALARLTTIQPRTLDSFYTVSNINRA